MASADYSVLTPERVSLQYDIAGIGSRGAAVIVDTIVQFVAVLVIMFAVLSTYAVSSAFLPFFRGPGAGVLLISLAALGILVVTAGYFMLFEIVWNGQTPGKRLVGVRVIRENGYPMRPVDAVIRNLVRIVDWLPGIYGIGVLTMLLNKRARRLGDFAAGTIVVREGSRGPGVVLAQSTLEVAPRGVALSNADATLIRDFLLRRASMNPHARAELAERLASVMARRYSVPLESNAELFLEHLAA
jgi:uncharacterized RDD family membrane protein YckC